MTHPILYVFAYIQILMPSACPILLPRHLSRWGITDTSVPYDNVFDIPSKGVHHSYIVRADGTYTRWLGCRNPGLKPCVTRLPVPMALTRGSHKTSITNPNAIGMSDLVAPGFIPVNQCVYEHQCRRHDRSCSTGIYPGVQMYV
ncbi:MAG TPA: hypothetical protein VFC67_04200 [Prolixibacteraceae bacterium]|nr:hypothetical protein [Prolixibacteraceae bacterium]